MSTLALEQRAFESRAKQSGRHFTGYAAVFGSRTNIGDPLDWGFVEEVAPGAFRDSLSAGDDVIFVQDHDPTRIMARTSNGTLRLAEDRTGLAVAADMADVSYARDVAELVRRGDVRGMSFRFQVVQDAWTTTPLRTPGGLSVDVDLRTLVAVKLIDVCTTASPAYADTDAAVRSAGCRPARNRSAHRPRPTTGRDLTRRMAVLSIRTGLPLPIPPRPGGRR